MAISAEILAFCCCGLAGAFTQDLPRGLAALFVGITWSALPAVVFWLLFYKGDPPPIFRPHFPALC